MGFEQLAELKQKLANEARAKKVANTDKSKNAATVDPIVLVIGKLQQLFPRAFPKFPLPKVPLKVGILEDLLSRSEEIRISHSDLRKAVKTWCQSSRYWQSCKEGAHRVDLDGNLVGDIDAKGAGLARAMARKAKTISSGLSTASGDKSNLDTLNDELSFSTIHASVAVEKQLPFPLKEPTPETKAAIMEADAIASRSKARFSNHEELLNDLEKCSVK